MAKPSNPSNPPSPATKAVELAAPLDLLLTSATKPFGSRMLPDATWARFAGNLAQHPGAVADRVGTLTRELGDIAVGKSHRVPARADKRFADLAWTENPLLHRIMQAYLAGSEVAEGLLADAELDWRDRRRCSSSSITSSRAWRPATTADQPAGLEGADRYRRPERGAGLESLCPGHAFEAAGAGDDRARRLRGGRDRGHHQRSGGVADLGVRTDPVRPADTQVQKIPLLMVPPVINKYYIMTSRQGAA